MENVFGETVGRVTSFLSRIFTGVSICCFLVNFFFFFSFWSIELFFEYYFRRECRLDSCSFLRLITFSRKQYL